LARPSRPIFLLTRFFVLFLRKHEDFQLHI
jgi:hypothetical protein